MNASAPGRDGQSSALASLSTDVEYNSGDVARHATPDGIDLSKPNVAPGSNRGSSDSDSKRSGSGSGSGTVKVHNHYPLSFDQQAYMDEVLEDEAREQNAQLLAMQLQLGEQEFAKKEGSQELLARMSDLLSCERSSEHLQLRLDRSRLANIDIASISGDLQDQVMALQARLEYQEENHTQKRVDGKTYIDKLAAHKSELNDEEYELFKAELDMARASLAVSREEQTEQVTQLGFRKEGKLQNDDDLASLLELYNKANREIDRWDRSKKSNSLKADDVAEAVRLGDALIASRETKREINAELAADRLELLRITALHNDQVAAMQARLKTNADSSRGKGPSRKNRQAAKSFGKGSLAAIEEELDVDDVRSQASNALSGVVSSSEGDGVVGDLNDFEDGPKITSTSAASTAASTAFIAMSALNEALSERIVLLSEEAQSAADANNQIVKDRSDLDGKHLTKITRMTMQLRELRAEQHASWDIIGELHDAKKDAQFLQLDKMRLEEERNAEVESAHQASLLRLAEKRSEAYDAHELNIENWHAELYFALESKRVESGRLMDLQRELVERERRHTTQVEDLNARLNLMAPEADATTSKTQAHENIVDMLREAEYDFNLQQNENDSMQVLMQDRIEQEQLLHAVTIADLRKAREQLEIEQHLSEEIKNKLLGVQQEISEANAPPKAHDNEMASSEDDLDKEKVFLGSFRCPSRHPSSSSRETLEPCTLESLWSLTTQLRGVVAFQCSAHLHILEATRKAFEIWGASALRCTGQTSIQNLASDSKTAAFLRQEILSRTTFSDRSLLREVGCLEFRDKNGCSFDSVVLVSHLPAKPDQQNGAALVVFVEPIEDKKAMQNSGSYGTQSSASGSSRRRPNSVRSQRNQIGSQYDTESITSSDICPGDSISNLF